MEQISGRQRLDTFFLKDADLIDYVQRMVGLSAIGKVYVEALIIAYGEGRNGKSTFWNVIIKSAWYIQWQHLGRYADCWMQKKC